MSSFPKGTWFHRYGELLLGFVCVAIYAAVTLWPATREFWHPQGVPNMLSDGTDPRGLLWAYEIIWDTLKTNPSRLLYGAIYSEMRDAPGATALWIPFVERALVIMMHPITNENTITTAVVWGFLVLNGMSAIWMGRSFRWPWFLTLPMALAFECNPFTRGRAVVHMGLAGIFYLPLILGSIERVCRMDPWEPPGQRDSTLIKCALAFLLAASSAHYYIIVTIGTVPMFAFFFFRRAKAFPNAGLFTRLKWLGLAALPSVLFVGWCFKMAVPRSLRHNVMAYPEADPAVNIQYLHDVGAHAIDYVAGDVKNGIRDVFPWREKLNLFIRQNLDYSHPQERANGIRWVFLFLGLLALLFVLAWTAKTVEERRTHGLIGFAFMLALYAFLLSLSPRGLKSYEDELGPSLLLYKLIPNFRVPSRFGPTVGLAVMMAATEFLSQFWRKPKSFDWFSKSAAFIVLMGFSVGEFLPLENVISTALRPARKELEHPGKVCGMGIFLPFSTYDYWAYEETRGTRCALVYPSSEKEAARLEAATRNDASTIELAKCMGVDWLVFRNGAANAPSVCKALDFQMVSQDSCRRAQPTPQKRTFAQCGGRR